MSALSQSEKMRLFEQLINELEDEKFFPRLTPQEIRKAAKELAEKFKNLSHVHNKSIKECLKILITLHLLETNPKVRDHRKHVLSHPGFKRLLDNFFTRLDHQHRDKFERFLLKNINPRFVRKDVNEEENKLEEPRPEPTPSAKQDDNTPAMDDLFETLTMMLGVGNPYITGAVVPYIARFLPNLTGMLVVDAFAGTGVSALENDNAIQSVDSPELAPGEEPGMHVPSAGAPSNRNWPPRLTPFDTKK